ncbi:hypothetical protein MD588_09260 [Photobacterium sp. SDRW27]|uniref:hypothetical protein n=1 Tax=Photobacterium obscurum TaxID=2829490 RepID=UPI0022442DCF|nr:hypothetical protein [Photobacterium obscurum]MCW8328994.1 hypothetical protein [Photobacterium obscurum]
MKKALLLLCFVFSGFTYAEFGGGSTVTVPHIVCMQNGEMLGTTAMPVTECNKLKAEQASKASDK